ncbi:MAG: hypothetical protein ACI8X5_001456 [Planctomycetota bacterium]|jgi:hypothetical protein
MARLANIAVFALLTAAPQFAGCQRQSFDYSLPEPEPEQHRCSVKDRETGLVTRSWSILAYADGRQLKHGEDRHWYPSGVRMSEGSFDHGDPSGRLRRWHENGQLKSDHTFSEDGSLSPMKFWYENGQLKALGNARHARREGFWEYWTSEGILRESGGYIDGSRSGMWTIYFEDGSVKSVGRYGEGDRIGTWQHFLLGERPGSKSD